MFLIHSVQSFGSKKSAISGMHIVRKLINCERTYENGVFRPYKVLSMKVLLVNTLLKKSLIYWESAFFLKLELKKMFFRMFRIWICMMYYRLVTTCLSTLNNGLRMNSIILLHKVGLSM